MKLNSWKGRFLSIAACLLLSLLIGNPVQAQIDTGTIQGIVKDQSGAVIPGAKVGLTNEGTGLILTVTTGPTGYYEFPGIRIGSYTIEVEAKGFSKYVRSGVTLHVQEHAVMDVTLVPGALTQTIEVRGAAPPLQTQDASRGQTIEARAVNDLPLNGRDWTSLAELSAGITYAQDAGGGRNWISANGTALEQTDYRLDGINNNMEAWEFPEPYVSLPPPDAIGEFKVEASNYSAQFGHSAGAVIDATVKSGVNNLHGDAWEYVRNDKFDAAEYFENAASLPKGAFRQNQFGATFGGPVYIPHVYNGKDKTFFFVYYQGTRIREALTTVDTVPTTTMRDSGYTDLQDLITYQGGTKTDNLGRLFPQGTVFDPATTRNVTQGQTDPVTGLVAPSSGLVRDPFYQGSIVGVTSFTSPAIETNLNLIPAGRLDKNAINLLNIYPVPQRSGFWSDYTYDAPLKNGTNMFGFRVDQNFSARDQMFVTGSWNHRLLLTPGAFPGVGGDAQNYYAGPEDSHEGTVAISETHFFSPTMINELRLGWSRNPMNVLGSQGSVMGIPEQFGIQGIPQVAGNGGLPAINISGLSNMGTAGWIPTLETSVTWDLTENLTKVYGKHTLKAGFQGDYIMTPILQPAWSHGQFDFGGAYTDVPYNTSGSTGMAQLLLTPTASSVPGGYNNVGGTDTTYASNVAGSDDRRNYYGAYLQDDWKVTQKLTVNLGLRWDHTTPYTEAFGAQANFVPGPPGNGAEFLIPKARCNDVNDPLSASFQALTKLDGIAVTCSSNSALSTVSDIDFAPRLGIAYRATHKMVLRASYGIFYGALGGEGYGLNIGNNYPFLYSFTYFNPDAAHPITYPTGAIGSLETGLSGIEFSPADVNAEGLSLAGRQYNYSNPYYEDYNFAVQYQVTPNQTFDLAYVGNEAHHQATSPATNMPSEILPPGVNPQNYVPFPDFARGSPYETTEANSYYNALQSTVERRVSGGLSFLANYTFSKCRTDWRSMDLSTNGTWRATTLPGFGMKGDYGYCDADVTNLFHFSGTYSLPLGKGRHFLGNGGGVANQVIGGWKLSWIVTMEDGMPFTISCTQSTTSDYGCNPLLVPGQNIYGGPHNVNQWINPAAFTNPPVATSIGQSNFAPLGGSGTQAHGPGEHRLDFSLFKQFPVSESKRFEFRAELFNLTNTPWFANPSYLTFTNANTFGRITSLRDGDNDPREIQLALKFYF